MSVVSQIKKTFETSFDKKWFDTYWAFDIHGTILKSTYDLKSDVYEFYPYAKESLMLISERTDITMILYTCSYLEEIQKYLDFFKSHDILFNHINENPDISSNNGDFGFYEQKFYFNVLFEDKAGFDPEKEWKDVYDLMLFFKENNITPNKKWSKKH